MGEEEEDDLHIGLGNNNKLSIYDQPEEDEFDLSDNKHLLKGMPIHGTLYDSSVQNEEVDDIDMEIPPNDTDDFLRDEQMVNDDIGSFDRKFTHKQTRKEAKLDSDSKLDADDEFGDGENEEEDEFGLDKEEEEEFNDQKEPVQGEDVEAEIDNLISAINDDVGEPHVNELQPKSDDGSDCQTKELLDAERLIAVTGDDDDNFLKVEEETMKESLEEEEKERKEAEENNQNSPQPSPEQESLGTNLEETNNTTSGEPQESQENQPQA
ncbi:hypothetical protein TRFO_08201 [Tritrichomonas foetus]|uniref:Uncharacterized protein n=1 Tax=Tritrichomonas foetus TaxID=1144522 RepID=A0A1J4JRL3_9EUKA|nr:hypothetical protein TRFO_08201 [Tritrichomonas foetus]|eukprot:OHS99892.1 hypothetical protein TRFO_08201 [Tritrichomonas foetus]